MSLRTTISLLSICIFSKTNVTELIDNQGVKMVFSGSSSGVAVAAGEICQKKGVLFFGTLTYSTATTGKAGHRHTFRECYDSWMAAKALTFYLNRNFGGKKYFYITADYTWGWTIEKAAAANPDVLVLVLFDYDMGKAANIAQQMGLKNKMQIVVPDLTLGMAEAGGPKTMQGVIGALPWCWKVPFKYNYPKGKSFVNKYAKKHSRYPSCSGGSAYTILYEYRAAVEKVNSFDSPKVIKVLEGRKYTMLKDQQVWRSFDHQSVQTVYAVKCKSADQVMQDKFQLDYFEILSCTPGIKATITRSEWLAAQKERRFSA